VRTGAYDKDTSVRDKRGLRGDARAELPHRGLSADLTIAYTDGAGVGIVEMGARQGVAKRRADHACTPVEDKSAHDFDANIEADGASAQVELISACLVGASTQAEVISAYFVGASARVDGASTEANGANAQAAGSVIVDRRYGCRSSSTVW
jgi:hypothetical protein